MAETGTRSKEEKYLFQFFWFGRLYDYFSPAFFRLASSVAAPVEMMICISSARGGQTLCQVPENEFSVARPIFELLF